MSCFALPNRFCDFWRDFNAVHRRRFPELPPHDLLRSLDCDIDDVDQAELARANWMWSRKPESCLGNVRSGYLILIFIGLVLLLVPYAGIVLAPVSWFAMFLVVAKGEVRLVRWRHEYESSIGRAVRSRRRAS
jgi:hypothetical protein